MATSEILGLFQTPEQYTASQDAAMQRQFLQRATLDPFQRASVLGQQAGYSAAQGIGGALGGTDPQLEMISRRNALLGQLNPSDPSSYARVAEAAAKIGDSQFAVLIAQEGRKAESERALVGQRGAAEQASLAQVAKINLTIRQEEELRSELSKLGSNATQDQVISVLTKYGPPEKVLAALTAAQSRTEATQARTETSAAANQARIDAAKVSADARIEAAKEAGATRLQVAQMQTDARRDIAQLAISLKEAASAELLTPKEKQKREAAYPQATSAISSFETKADSFIKDIEKLRDSPGLSEITGFAAGRLPGLTANGRAAQALYDKIVAKGGFQALQDLRDASKTGGALGNVSNQEGKQLTASFSAIDRRQDAKDVRAALDQAIGDIQGSKTRLREAYDMTYSYKSEQPKGGLGLEDQQALDWANKNPNDPRSAQIKNRLGAK